jgi:hypothetical protein
VVQPAVWRWLFAVGIPEVEGNQVPGSSVIVVVESFRSRRTKEAYPPGSFYRSSRTRRARNRHIRRPGKFTHTRTRMCITSCVRRPSARRRAMEKPVRVPLRKTRIIQRYPRQKPPCGRITETDARPPHQLLHPHCTAVYPLHDLSLTRRRKAIKTRWKRRLIG